ncbi:Dpy-30-domain-containing protein [Coccomyxa subellipsoidea C-169]|uniref:Protein dpy-30 homolog n=1 Tax=Coccomyxa subellipsoidea (strain C-169) TaxID=574566 RepID=I0YW89_COCSC|nr:Dpy-30-domain-containing protein [Coccomyxa subellipsoidea C-169]EIE22658.1 Dpy-30-domain-containing protein [Coccomyxa subellipsoidea C-169]|eukprot:XP_005647202.1 Dpy-30-domain-containing protein [Coccomyxa subellipsoidea C-169]
MGDEPAPSGAPSEPQSGSAKNEPASNAAAASNAPPAASAQAPKKPADKAAKPTDLKSLNVRQYLEATVVQVLMKGMQEVVRQRPDDPLEFLGQYLLKHNPKKSAAAGAAAATASAGAPK